MQDPGTEPPDPSGDRTPASTGRPGPTLRVVAASIATVALATLIGIRLGTDGTGPGAPPADSTTATTVEAARDDPPSRLTRAQLGGIRFTDITAAAGLLQPHSERALTAATAMGTMTSAAAVGDIDADGWPDLYLTRIGRPNSLYRNNGDGTFTDLAESTGVAGPSPAEGSGPAAFADVDGNGCDDLFVGATGRGATALYMNDCTGSFTEEASRRGVDPGPTDAALGAQEHGVTFADFDHDGDLDLLVLQWYPPIPLPEATAPAAAPPSMCERAAGIRERGGGRVEESGPDRSRLLRNDGTGNFVDVTVEAGLRLDLISAFTGEFVDIDDDGWEDLLIAGDFCTSTLYRNVGGTRFVDITRAAGVGTDENGMGSVVRDVNGDGRPDWFVTGISLRTTSRTCPGRDGSVGCSGNRLYLNSGRGTFVDATDRHGVRHGWWGWGAAIEDFGNDGRLEIAQTNGYVGSDAPYDRFVDDPTRFWVPTGSGAAHEDGAALAGLTDAAVGHALVAFDADRDGDLDLLIANFGAPPTLYRNDTPGDRHWVTVALDDPGAPGNRRGLGTRVTVRPGSRAGRTGEPVTGWISTGGSYESARPPEFHVGLGENPSPVRIEVRWPGDDAVQVVDDAEVDRVVTVTRR